MFSRIEVLAVCMYHLVQKPLEHANSIVEKYLIIRMLR